ADRLATAEAIKGADAAANATGKVVDIASGDQVFVHNGTALTVQSVNPDARTITFGADHGLANGDAVVYRSPVGTTIDPLLDGQTYYVVKVDATTIKLVSSADAAMAGDASAVLEVRLGQSTSYFDPGWPDNSAHGAAVSTRDASGQQFTHDTTTLTVSTIDGLRNKIVFTADHGLATGDALVYHAQNGYTIPGLRDGATYYAYVPTTGADAVKTVYLFEQQGDALAAVPSTTDPYGRLMAGELAIAAPLVVITFTADTRVLTG